MNYNYEILKSQFAQLDELSRTIHMQHATLQQEHTALQEGNTNLHDYLKEQQMINIKNNEETKRNNEQMVQLHAQNDDLQNRIAILKQEKEQLEKWKSDMISSRTYSLIKKINNIKKIIKK